MKLDSTLMHFSNKKSYAESSFYIVTVFISLVSSVPILLGIPWCIGDQSELGYKTLHKVVASSELYDITVAILGSVTPMVIFVICDIVHGNLPSFKRCYRLLCMIIPCIIILLIAIPQENEILLATAVESQSIFHLGAFFALIFRSGGNHWTYNSTVTIQILWSVTLCLKLFRAVTCQTIWILLLIDSFFLMGMFIMIYKIYYWLRAKISIYVEYRKLSSDDYECGINILGLLIVAALRSILDLAMERSNPSFCFMFHLISQNFMVLIVIVLDEYELGRRITKLQV